MNLNLPDFVLKRNRKTRRLRVTVFPGGKVLVTAPFGVSDEVVTKFLQSKSEWLWEKVGYFRNVPSVEESLEKDKLLFAESKEKVFKLASEKVLKWNRFYNFAFAKITIGRSRSRWGSVSSKGVLSFNYKMLFLPEELADYLAVHEICHLKERNHGPNFWSLVSKTIPDYILKRKALKKFNFKF